MKLSTGVIVALIVILAVTANYWLEMSNAQNIVMDHLNSYLRVSE
jgi:hypothetical protein